MRSNRHITARFRGSVFVVATTLSALLGGCASAPSPGPVPPVGSIATTPGNFRTPIPSPSGNDNYSVGSEIVIRAISLLGAPYRYGGSGPTAFDCSGLVKYIHEEIGIGVPRTAAEQYRAAEPVRMEEIEPGDLVFFRTRGKQVSHVGIYAGSGRFVHAPQTGRPVEIRALDDGYYRPRLAGVGRLF